MFKPIPDYPDYAINEQGQIMSYRRRPEGKLMKGTIDNNGYIVVTLWGAKKAYKQHLVHRLIAQAFIPNPDNLPFINHIDENPANNQISNLEWCTLQYNTEYSRAKYYLIEHVATGVVSEVFNLKKWCRDNNMNDGNLTGTFTHPHRHPASKGYRILDVKNAPDDLTSEA